MCVTKPFLVDFIGAGGHRACAEREAVGTLLLSHTNGAHG